VAALIGRGLLALLGVELMLAGGRQGKIHYPRAKFKADPYGWRCTVRTVPRVSRRELEKAAPFVADYWRCSRVGVTQIKPGRIMLRALRSDPLAQPFGPSGAPPGIYTADHLPRRLYLGRDGFGEQRYLPLANVSGLTIAGLPGSGKSSLIRSLMCQTAGSPAVAYGLLDGKGGGDLRDFQDRADSYGEDDLAEAIIVLLAAKHEMVRRLALVAASDRRNAWHRGPTPEMPLLMIVIDECQQYLDVGAYKGDRTLEPLARQCVALVAELVRKGRAVMVMCVLASQKVTTDSLPSTIRDNAALSLSFAVKTREAAVAALGESIREYETYSPVLLRDPAMVGVCSATLPTGSDPFALIRVPEVSERIARLRGAETAHLRQDARPAVVTVNGDSALATVGGVHHE
jgi:S-DNA-T family DNA segregation ATPase FtsK/SpoIIIE